MKRENKKDVWQREDLMLVSKIGNLGELYSTLIEKLLGDRT